MYISLRGLLINYDDPLFSLHLSKEGKTPLGSFKRLSEYTFFSSIRYTSIAINLY
jgi:hypothetical protein